MSRSRLGRVDYSPSSRITTLCDTHGIPLRQRAHTTIHDGNIWTEEGPEIVIDLLEILGYQIEKPSIDTQGNHSYQVKPQIARDAFLRESVDEILLTASITGNREVSLIIPKELNAATLLLSNFTLIQAQFALEVLGCILEPLEQKRTTWMWQIFKIRKDSAIACTHSGLERIS